MKKFFALPLIAAILTFGFYTPSVNAETVAAPAKIEAAPVAAGFEKPVYYAVTFYADTCGSCKILDPAIKQARADAALDGGDVLFVTMDFSNKASISQSKLKAAAMGIDGYVKSMGAKTGYMALLNNEGTELAKFTKADDAAAIAAGIKTALAE